MYFSISIFKIELIFVPMYFSVKAISNIEWKIYNCYFFLLFIEKKLAISIIGEEIEMDWSNFTFKCYYRSKNSNGVGDALSFLEEMFYFWLVSTSAICFDLLKVMRVLSVCL